MKKLLLLILSVLGVMGCQAQLSGSMTNVNMDELIEMIKNVQGHVFLSKGESRSLEDIIRNSSVINSEASVKELTWSTTHNNVVDVDSEDGTITGVSFGQSIVTVNDPKGDNFYLAVFVCPTITVKSAEGVIYKHQKMYNSPAKLQLTQSKEWLVNCVMRDGVDVTDLVDEKGIFDTSREADPAKRSITSDMILTVSMESRNENENGLVVGNSGINLQVNSATHTLTFEDGGRNLIQPGMKIDIYDIFGKNLYGQGLPASKSIRFLDQNEGVFKVKIEGIDGWFKIIMQRDAEIL